PGTDRSNKKHQNFILDLVKDLSIEQLNKIPDGFNNNIIWNIAHLTAAQQNLCYTRSGLLPTVTDKYLFPFFKRNKT
ncbi:DinB family protein, partial [Pseudomonas viridiflava]|uniref:DinB family protein n=1 Tax=Pseudomonas viridiflava TaxID=33069 RepID=UPI00198225C6